jgi:hypothetical protein
VAIAAGVIADLFMPALVALGLMAAQLGRAALPNGLEDAPLRRRRDGPITGQIGCPILPGDVGHFHRRADHGWSSHVAGRGNVSSGLGIAASAWGLTWR